MADDVCFDVWVCRGRVCSANGSEGVADAFDTAVAGTSRVRVLRGGCYGLCELGPNGASSTAMPPLAARPMSTASP